MPKGKGGMKGKGTKKSKVRSTVTKGKKAGY